MIRTKIVTDTVTEVSFKNMNEIYEYCRKLDQPVRVLLPCNGTGRLQGMEDALNAELKARGVKIKE